MFAENFTWKEEAESAGSEVEVQLTPGLATVMDEEPDKNLPGLPAGQWLADTRC